MTFAARLFSTPRYHHLPQMICCCSEALPLVLLTNAQDFQLLEVVWSVKKVVSEEGRRKGRETTLLRKREEEENKRREDCGDSTNECIRVQEEEEGDLYHFAIPEIGNVRKI